MLEEGVLYTHMDIQKNNMMRVLLYVCVGLLSILTLLGAYSLYTLNYVIPEVSVEKPSDSDTNKDSHILTEEEVKAQLEALAPEVGTPILTEEEVKAQLEALTKPQ